MKNELKGKNTAHMQVNLNVQARQSDRTTKPNEKHNYIEFRMLKFYNFQHMSFKAKAGSS